MKLARKYADLVEKKALSSAAILSLAYPDRVAKRRGGDGEHWASRGGRGFRLDTMSHLAKEQWLAVGDIQGAASGARIMTALALDEAEIEDLFAKEIRVEKKVRFRKENGSIEATRSKKLGAISLSSGSDSDPDQ